MAGDSPPSQTLGLERHCTDHQSINQSIVTRTRKETWTGRVPLRSSKQNSFQTQDNSNEDFSYLQSPLSTLSIMRSDNSKEGILFNHIWFVCVTITGTRMWRAWRWKKVYASASILLRARVLCPSAWPWSRRGHCLPPVPTFPTSLCVCVPVCWCVRLPVKGSSLAPNKQQL